MVDRRLVIGVVNKDEGSKELGELVANSGSLLAIREGKGFDEFVEGVKEYQGQTFLLGESNPRLQYGALAYMSDVLIAMTDPENSPDLETAVRLGVPIVCLGEKTFLDVAKNYQTAKSNIMIGLDPQSTVETAVIAGQEYLSAKDIKAIINPGWPQ